MNIFQSAGMNRPKKNKFDLSHEKKLSMNMGDLVPILLQEIVPGDSFRVNSEIMIRLAPMLAPIMHRVNVYTHYFFVPNRLLWDEWQDFITGGREGNLNPVPPKFVVDPTKDAQLFKKGTIWDYFGLPPFTPSTVASTLEVSSLPFRAYQLIYNDLS